MAGTIITIKSTSAGTSLKRRVTFEAQNGVFARVHGVEFSFEDAALFVGGEVFEDDVSCFVHFFGGTDDCDGMWIKECVEFS